MPDADQTYVSPLASRNASPAMQHIWSPDFKFRTWRRLWLALAESEAELGLNITDAQLDALRTQVDAPIDYAKASEYEAKLRHDVMAHVHTLADAAPEAGPIVHLGATSQFVVCNTELLQMRSALELVAGKLAAAIDRLGRFAQQHKALPTLGFTHYQPAQPTTVGKRAAGWAHDLALALEEVEYRLASLRFRGVKGTTGTQASFLELFHGDHTKVDQLDRRVTEKMGWATDRRFALTGQTYPRVVDGMVVATLASVASSAMKFANDMRLLANRKELEEPFGKSQIGSSAMPYKRNPMRCERIGGLGRFVIGMTQTPFVTASEQWLERTLDDSSCRRLTLPEPFLAVDGVLDLVNSVADGIVVYEKTVAANLAKELPFMASENILMQAVKAGGDRQALHEKIRQHSQASADRVKREGAENDLLDRLKSDGEFSAVQFDEALDPAAYTGRAPELVDVFLTEVVEPIRQRYADHLGDDVALKV